MSTKPQPLPYVDNSRTDDAASFVSTLPSPSVLSTDTETVAPLLNESQNGNTKSGAQYIKPPLVTTPAQQLTTATTQDGQDKIIMTSVPIAINRASASSKSLFNRFKPNTKLKIVLMPQSEYAKYFARDKSGAYIGTEEERSWTEAELDERYGGYKSALPVAPMRVGSALTSGGGWSAVAGYGNGMS
jgi:hypothetical protein